MENITVNDNKLFFKGAKLNLQVFHNLNLENKNLEFLHLISSVILSGNFEHLNFYNASFLGTKFSDVYFKECTLKSTDICSIWAKDCYFKKTDFTNATISDCTFINCVFDDAIFESISLTKCQFIKCTFEQFLIDDSTFSLNSYLQCHIKNTEFTESFYYQIFDNCIFENANMSPMLLGFNFGFSLQTFTQLTAGFDLIKIKEDFISQGLYINAAIFRVNEIQNYYDEALLACIAALGKMVQNDILVKGDEIEFLKNLTSYFQEHQQIAPITILRIWHLLNSYFIDNSINTSSMRAMPHIQEYINMLYFNFIDFQEQLQKLLDKIPKSTNEMAELKIIYSEKPELPLLKILNDFCTCISIDCPHPRLIRTEKGSFHEFHEIATIAIPYLQTFFSFLGVIIPIVIYKKQKKENKNKEQIKKEIADNSYEKTIIQITLPNSEVRKKTILLPNTAVTTSSTNGIISDVEKVIHSQMMTNSTDFCGYNNQNIKSITIQFY